MAEEQGILRALTDRQQLLDEIKAARAQVLAAIERLPEEQCKKPAVDGWSVKDHINHLTACDEIRFFEISRVSQGGRAASRVPEGEPMDAFNESIVTQRRHLPMEQAIADLNFARSLVTEAIMGAPEHALDPKAYVNYAVNGSIEHDFAHAAAIREWRKSEGI